MQFTPKIELIMPNELIRLALSGRLYARCLYQGIETLEPLPLENVCIVDGTKFDASDLQWRDRTCSVDRLEIFINMGDQDMVIAYEDLPTYSVVSGTFSIVWPAKVFDLSDAEFEMPQLVL